MNPVFTVCNPIDILVFGSPTRIIKPLFQNSRNSLACIFKWFNACPSLYVPNRFLRLPHHLVRFCHSNGPTSLVPILYVRHFLAATTCLARQLKGGNVSSGSQFQSSLAGTVSWSRATSTEVAKERETDWLQSELSSSSSCIKHRLPIYAKSPQVSRTCFPP